MKTMPNSTQEEKYRWIKPILDNKTTIEDMNEVCPFSKRSLKYWLKHYREKGMEGLKNKSTRPKTNPKETSIRVKEKIITLRKEKDCCAKKLSWILREEGIKIHPRTVHKIIKKEGLTRKYRTRKVRCNYVKVPLKVGELVEIDIKYVPSEIDGKKCYQYTAIDSATRWRYLKVYDDKSNYSSLRFLKQLIETAPFRIQSIKTDNDSCFTNRYTGYKKSSDPLNPRLHSFDVLCNNLSIDHYLIDPGKPAQNGKVERSHRTDQEKFYDKVEFNSLEELRYKLKLWNMHYNDTKHCSLNGKSPNQALGLKVQNVHA